MNNKFYFVEQLHTNVFVGILHSEWMSEYIHESKKALNECLNNFALEKIHEYLNKWIHSSQKIQKNIRISEYSLHTGLKKNFYLYPSLSLSLPLKRGVTPQLIWKSKLCSKGDYLPRPGDLVVPFHFGHFFGLFWSLLDNIWPIWTRLFEPVYLDLSIGSDPLWPVCL